MREHLVDLLRQSVSNFWLLTKIQLPFEWLNAGRMLRGAARKRNDG
jgi:hypothetical protein